jgi:hypothetical protein
MDGWLAPCLLLERYILEPAKSKEDPDFGSLKAIPALHTAVLKQSKIGVTRNVILKPCCSLGVTTAEE